MRGFLDYFGLWTAINMTGWFILWWGYDKTVTWEDDLNLLFRTSVGATAITLAVWGVARASRIGSFVPRKYSKAVEDALDGALKVDTRQQDERSEGPQNASDGVV